MLRNRPLYVYAVFYGTFPLKDMRCFVVLAEAFNVKCFLFSFVLASLFATEVIPDETYCITRYHAFKSRSISDRIRSVYG